MIKGQIRPWYYRYAGQAERVSEGLIEAVSDFDDDIAEVSRRRRDFS